ncbi:MAG: hypothetical protein H6849_03955 [Alphaproteobacteria bacterium]|nr:MAG: hypothetical protein H6849_03955 [Alphaproteobacteria bacterium]
MVIIQNVLILTILAFWVTTNLQVFMNPINASMAIAALSSEHVHLGGLSTLERTVLPPDSGKPLVPSVINKLLYIAPGLTSSFSALQELRYIEAAAGLPIGELFSAGAGASFAGSFLAAAFFSRKNNGKYRTVTDVENLLRNNLPDLLKRKSGFLCFPPRHVFDRDCLTRTLQKIFGEAYLSSIEKPIYFHTRIRGTNAEYLFASGKARSNPGDDYTLVDVIASTSATKGLFKSRAIVSRGDVTRRLRDIVPIIPDTALPSLLAFKDETGCSWDSLGMIAVGYLNTPHGYQSTLNPQEITSRHMERVLQINLGDRFIRMGIDYSPEKGDPHSLSPDAIRRLIHNANPRRTSNEAFERTLRNGMHALNLAPQQQLQQHKAGVVLRSNSGKAYVMPTALFDAERTRRARAPHALISPDLWEQT